jgi:hypothetical protein
MLSELQMSLCKRTGKSCLRARHEGCFTTALGGSDWSGSRLGRSTPVEGTQDCPCRGSRVGDREGVCGLKKGTIKCRFQESNHIPRFASPY